MKGEKGVELPLGVFLQRFVRDLLQGAMKSLIKLTTVVDESEDDFVEGYEDFIFTCIKPVTLSIIEKDLSFVLSASNLTLFCHNFSIAKKFVSEWP